MRIGAWVLAVTVLASSTVSADKTPSRKDKAQAKAHIDKAAAASKDGRDADALTELDAAYALDPEPNVLFARGQLNAKLNKCDVAITLYQQFVASQPPPAQQLVDMANQGIDACTAALAPPPPPPPEPAKVTEQELEEDKENPTTEKIRVAPPKPAPVASAPSSVAPAPAGPRHWYKDPLLIGLGVGGVLSISGGVIAYVVANRALDNSETADTYEDWRLYVNDAHQARRYAVMFGAGAAALVGATVLLYVERYAGHDEPAVTVSPANHGAVVGWTGRF